MSKLSLADIHCDTAYEMFMRHESFISNSLSTSVALSACYEKYTQCMAVWSDKRLDNDQAYKQCFEIINYLRQDVLKSSEIYLYDKDDNHNRKKRILLILSVEDARILNNDLSRLDVLHRNGVKILTFLWSGVTCIGGSYDTSVGLTDFGKKVLQKCIDLRIIPDISHASAQSIEDVFEICDGNIPVIASHSDSYSIHPHPRNLTDEHFAYIKQCKGLVGINLCYSHLGISQDDKGALKKIINHIEYYLSLGGEDILCYGCDFDGAKTPAEFRNISSLSATSDELAKLNYSDDLINKIFFTNVENFIKNNFEKY